MQNQAKHRQNYHHNDAYRFDGWIEDFSYVTDNINITPEFNRVDRYYDVTFFDSQIS